jgi:uncharacterized protein (UPF0335 family)
MTQSDTANKLRSYIDRIENVAQERKALTQDIADILKQAKSDGFDVKVMRQVLKLRTMSKAERQEAQHLIDTYMAAVDPQMEMFEDREKEPA